MKQLSTKQLKYILSRTDFDTWIFVLEKRNQGLSFNQIGKQLDLTGQRIQLIQKQILHRTGKKNIKDVTVSDLEELQKLLD